MVLVSGLVERKGVYVPRTYKEYGPNGLSGGHMRVHAAVCLCAHGETDLVLFSGGGTPGVKGKDVPSGARVFAREFEAMLPVTVRPSIVLEERSADTYGNVAACLPLVRSCRRVGWLSSEFHLPRVRELCLTLAGSWRTGSGFVFVSAEETVRRLRPGVFDREIDAAYASEPAQVRREMEAKGIDDIRAGRYHTLWKRAVKYSLGGSRSSGDEVTERDDGVGALR